MEDTLMRQLARHQWVRRRGTPRVTVLVGDERASATWRTWVATAQATASLLEASTVAEFDQCVREAVARAEQDPALAIAVVTTPVVLARWRRGRRDRMQALVEEGLVEVERRAPARVRQPRAKRATPTHPAQPTATAPTAPTAARAPSPPRTAAATAATDARSLARPRAARFVATAQELQARSAAELAMLRALEATPATAGRFELNARLSVRFGGTAAEVDLLARAEGVAVEIDGVFHFDDAGDYRRDRRKDLLLQLQGLIVVRVLAEDVMQDPTAAVRAVCEALAVRQLRPGGPGAPGAAHRRKARG